MLKPPIPRLAHICAISLASACFSPNVAPLDVDESSGTSDTPSSGTTSPSTGNESLDEGSSSGEPNLCGNAVLDPGEVCDDGLNDNGYGGCSEDCLAQAARCGDGLLQDAEGEACDDGDDIDGNGCNIDCIVSGTLLWSDIVDGTSSGISDRGETVAVAPDDTIIVTGIADNSGATIDKLWLRRYTSDGSVSWTEIRIDEGNIVSADVQFLDSGALIVGALYDDPSGPRFPRVFGYTLDGVPSWDFTHTVSYTHFSIAAAVGGFVALATDLNEETWMRRFDAVGMPQWTETSPVMFNYSDIASHPDGGFVLAGLLGADVWVRRYTSEGDELWTQMLESFGLLGEIMVLPSEDIVLAGYGGDYWVEGLNSDGASQWRVLRPEPDGWFYASAVAASPEGDIIVAGQRKQAADPDLGQLHVARYSSTGSLMWEQSRPSPFSANGNASASGVAVDSAGRINVIGTVSTDVNRDFWILQFAP